MTHFLLFSTITGLLGLFVAGQGHAQTRPNLLAMGSKPAAAAAAAGAAAAAALVKPDSVYVNPEVRPCFTGGDKAFAAYLSKSIRYPEKALRNRTSGRVYVNFVLNAQGRVTDAHVVSGPGNGLNDEALRLVWLMPPWEPARSNGQPVRVACTVPIAFNSNQ